MTLIYRLQKGCPLTLEEMDDNFRNLHERLKVLEERPAMAETFQDIKVEGEHLTLTSSYGTTYGPFILPTVTFSPQGVWLQNKAYAVYDLVNHGEALYLCIRSHSSKEFTAEKEHWRLLLERPAGGGEAVATSQNAPLALLPAYEKETLPLAPSLGTLALIFGEDSFAQPIYGDGQGWRYVHNQKPL